MDIFNPQFVSQFAKLDSIQVMLFIVTILIGGLMVILFLMQRGNNATTKALLETMQTQSKQSNDRENKLATSIETQVGESSKLSKILLLLHREQKRQGSTQDDIHKLLEKQHLEEMAKLDEVLTELRSVKITVDKQPVESGEIKSRLDRLLGHLEILIPKIRITSEVAKVPSQPEMAIPSPP